MYPFFRWHKISEKIHHRDTTFSNCSILFQLFIYIFFYLLTHVIVFVTFSTSIIIIIIIIIIVVILS